MQGVNVFSVWVINFSVSFYVVPIYFSNVFPFLIRKQESMACNADNLMISRIHDVIKGCVSFVINTTQHYIKYFMLSHVSIDFML